MHDVEGLRLATSFALAEDYEGKYYVVVNFQFPVMACSISIPADEAEAFGLKFLEEMGKAAKEAKRIKTGLVKPNAQETRKVTQSKS